jgi:hypothetical protein
MLETGYINGVLEKKKIAAMAIFNNELSNTFYKNFVKL